MMEGIKKVSYLAAVIIISFMTLLVLSGCGSGEYYVEQRSANGNIYICSDGKPPSLAYMCKFSTPWPFAENPTIAICSTQEECNQICEKKRGKWK